MTFHLTAGGAQATTAKMSGVELLAGSNLTITPSTTLAGRPAYTLASTASGTGDVSAASNFGTDNVLIKSDGTSKGTQATGISIADTTNNMSGVGTISSGAITATGTSTFATAIEPDADDGATIGSANKNWSDIFLADSAVLNFGDDQDTTLTHTDGSGLTLNSTNKLMFGDSASYIHQSADGVLDLVSDTEIELTGPTLDLNASTAVTIDTAAITITTDTATFTSTNANDPLVVIKNTTNDANGAVLRFVKDKGAAGAANDVAGVIEFVADDASQDQVKFSEIKSQVAVHTNGQEGGKLSLGVASHDGEMQYGIVITDGDAEDEVDVTIGSGEGSLVLINGDLQVNGSHTTVNSTVVTIDDLSFNMAADETTSANLDGAGIILGAANYASGSSFSNNPTLLYDHTGTRWEFSAHDVEMPADVFIGNDLSLTSDGALFTMGADSGFIITHDSDIGATIAGSPITITAAEASTWSTSSGALTLTSAAACTWSAAAGNLTLDSAAGTANLDGHTGVQITSSSSGNIDLDAAADIVLDVADNKHVFFQEGGVTHSAIAHGTVEITDLAGTANATAIDVFDCTVFQAVKYFILVEDRAADHYMTTEILVLGDDNGASAATAVMTTYAVLFNEAELGVFTVAGSGNNITLSYNPTDQSGTDQHRVRVVANRIASLSDAGQ
jgi:hypothetical protein